MTDMRQQLQFTFEVDGSYLYFDASESGLHLFFYPLVHFIEVAHPNQSVDRNALLSF